MYPSHTSLLTKDKPHPIASISRHEILLSENTECRLTSELNLCRSPPHLIWSSGTGSALQGMAHRDPSGTLMTLSLRNGERGLWPGWGERIKKIGKCNTECGALRRPTQFPVDNPPCFPRPNFLVHYFPLRYLPRYFPQYFQQPSFPLTIDFPQFSTPHFPPSPYKKSFIQCCRRLKLRRYINCSGTA